VVEVEGVVMLRKLLMLSAMLCGLVAVVSTVPAQAAPVDYSGCILSVTPTNPNPGADVQVTGSGFQPNFQTHVIFDRFALDQADLGTVTTDANGAFTTTVTIPANAIPGLHSLTADCSADIHSGFGFTFVFLGAGGGTTGGTAGGSSGGSTGGSTSGITVNVTLTLSKSVVQRLEQFTATVRGAAPGGTVQFFQLSTKTSVGSAVADANGTAVLPMSFPATAELGLHHVEATGIDPAGQVFDLQQPITVVATAVSGRSGFPVTGTNAGPMALAGLGALGLGAALVTMSRRRRAASSS
jgi:hypothetical protein